MSATKHVVAFESHHLEALGKALEVMREERKRLRRWDTHSGELSIAFDDVEDLYSRMRVVLADAVPA